MSDPYLPAPQTTPTRNAARVSYDRAAVHAVLDEALICHVGFVVDGEPIVLPQLHARVGDRLYLHGSTCTAPPAPAHYKARAARDCRSV